MLTFSILAVPYVILKIQSIPISDSSESHGDRHLRATEEERGGVLYWLTASWKILWNNFHYLTP